MSEQLSPSARTRGRVVDGGGALNDSLTRYRERILRYRWLVVSFAALAVAIAAGSALHAHTAYTGKSVLVMSSSGRSPDQDAVMTNGYAQVFNDPGTIERLEAANDIPSGAEFEARTAANSPILVVEATANDPVKAQSAATEMAQAFRTDVNGVRQRSTAEAVAQLSQQLTELRNQPGPDGVANPALGVLQERINEMRFDSTNQLQDLQPRAGVVASSPNLGRNMALGAVGGTLLGIIVALALASVSTRLTSAADIRAKVGVDPLVEIPDGQTPASAAARGERVRTLANLVAVERLPKPTTVALIDTGSGDGSWSLAVALGESWSKQGYRTVLVDAVGGASGHDDVVGLSDALADSANVADMLQDSGIDSPKILPTGSGGSERFACATRRQVDAVLDELRMDADVTVIALPPVTEKAEAQLLCAAADLNILVITRGQTRVEEVASATDRLAMAHAVLLGAVLVEKPSS